MVQQSPSGASHGNGQQQQQIHLDQDGKLLRGTLIGVKYHIVSVKISVLRIVIGITLTILHHLQPFIK